MDLYVFEMPCNMWSGTVNLTQSISVTKP